MHGTSLSPRVGESLTLGYFPNSDQFPTQKGVCSLKKILISSILFAVAFVTSAVAQPPKSGGVKSDSSSKSDSSALPSPVVDSINTRSVPAKNLMQQRLHSAAFPHEAEVRCGVLEGCAVGLSRGFVLGGDLLASATTTLLGQQFYGPGAWVLYDGFVGYQFLQGADSKVFANGSVGYRGYSYRKEIGASQEERSIKTSGFTFRIAYGQEINSVYTQGVNMALFSGVVQADSPQQFRNLADGATYRKMLREFYTFSQQHPTLRLGMPADFEVINWKASHVDLPNNLRGYGRLEPFYIQNEMVIEGELSSKEKNFGVRAMALLSYESVHTGAGRFALLAGIGFDVSGSNSPTTEYSGDAPVDDRVLNEKLPARKVFTPVLNLEGSYKF